MRAQKGDVAAALDDMTARYQVSPKVAAWQVRNGAGLGAIKTAAGHALIDDLTVQRLDIAG